MYLENKYIVTLEYKDSKGNIEIRGAALDNMGPMASGYPCWSLYNPKEFTSFEDAEKFFYEHKEYLLRDIQNTHDVNLNSITIAIRKLVLTHVKNIDINASLQDIEQKKKDKADYAEYQRLKAKFEGRLLEFSMP